MFNENIILENNFVSIRPLNEGDFEGFSYIAFDERIWKFTTSRISNEDELQKYIFDALNEKETELRYPFTVIDKSSNRIAGSTSYLNYSTKDQRIEIGHSWLGKEFQGKGINRETKFLLIDYAFTQLKIKRVEFKTDVLNIQARKALLKIGATEEGILRSHTLMHDGRRRDTIFYSILYDEWKKLNAQSF